MKAYLILFVIMFSLQFIKVKTDRAYLFRCLITFIPFFLFGALRTDCGDYESYKIFFESAHGSASYLWANERMEVGFAFLNYIMPSYRALIVFTSLFISFAYAYFFYKIIPRQYTWLAIIFLFLSADKSIYFMLGAMRNSMAIAFLLLSVTFIYDRRYVMMILSTLAASLFHMSAIIFFPIAFIVARNRQMKMAEFSIWLVVMLILIITPVSTLLEGVVPYVDIYFERYESYVEESWDSGMLVTFGSVIMALPALLYMFQNKELTKEDNTIGRLALCFMYSYLLGSLNMRISHYFVLFLLPFIVKFYANTRWKAYSVPYIAFCGMFLAYSFFVVSLNNINSPFILFKSIFS